MAKIKDFLTQKEHELITNDDMFLILDLTIYKMDDNLIIDNEEKTIWVKSLISRVEYEDKKLLIR